MTHCELQELQISALLDGEADLHEQKAVLDHMLDCADCRLFYEEARGFQELVDGLPLAPSPTAAPGSRLRRFASDLPAWARAAAILLVLALGIVIGLGAGGGVSPGESPGEFAIPSGEQTIDLRLASEAGSMSDARFTSLTLDLLRADTRYQRKMFEILRILAPEGQVSTEGGFDRAMELEGAEQRAQRSLGETESVNGPAISGRRSIY
jgi:hypothetical protein